MIVENSGLKYRWVLHLIKVFLGRLIATKTLMMMMLLVPSNSAASSSGFTKGIVTIENNASSQINEDSIKMATLVQSQNQISSNITFITFAIVLAVLTIISLILTRKFNRQKKQLIKANAEVKRVNEHLEELVSNRTAQLLQTNQELDTFLYKSSHDLRRPLTSIIGLSNLAKMSLGAEASELFDRAAHTARSMDRMLQKLINVNQINNPSHYSRIDFTKQVPRSFDIFEDLIVDHNIETSWNIKNDIQFSSYPDLIDIILQNLIENALFFSSVEQNNGRPLVQLDVLQENGHVAIRLKDNGCGINPSIHNKIWNMFFVGHEKSNGNGLGLYITKKAVNTLEGKITLESSDKGNTLFEVILPTNGA